MNRSVAYVALLILGLGCGDDERPLEGATDASVPDASPADGGAPDTGPPDTGVSPACEPVLGTPLDEGIAPDARDDMAYAVDPACGRVFMFFGDQGVPMACSFAPASFAGDAFVFDARRDTWFRLEPQGESPIARDRASAIWDAKRERVVLFGGRWRPGTSGPYTFLDDVWAYTPATNRWERLDSDGASPEGRMDFLMVADPEADRFVISHGGRFTPDFFSFIVYDDTWAFDLETNQWSQLSTTGTPPPGSVYPAGVLDRERRHLWLFSGSGQDAFTAPPRLHMGVLDLVTGAWSNLTPDATWPEARFNSAMIHDRARDRLIMFAGHDTTNLGNDNDLYAFDLDTRRWTTLREGDVENAPPIDQCTFPGNFTVADLDSPERRAAHLFAVVDEEEAIMYGGNTDCGIANDTWRYDLATDDWSQITVSPVGMTCPRTGNPNCDDPAARMCD